MGRIARLIERLFRRKPRRPPVEAGEPPYDEPALVPRRPRPSPASGTAVLDPPDEPSDIDARSHEDSGS